MTYEHRSNVGNKKVSSTMKTTIIIVIVLAIVYIIFPNLFASLFTKVMRPFWGYQESIARSEITLSKELYDSTIVELQRENQQLKQALNRSVSSSTVLAYILKKPPFSAYDSFIIDIGKDKNIKVGDKVYALGKVLIGEINEIYTNTSRVKLYSSYGEKYEVSINIQNANAIQIGAEGLGGGMFQAILPRDVKVSENDIVTIPNLSSSVFGIVRKVIVEPAKTFETIYFSQPINIYEQNWVEVENDKQ